MRITATTADRTRRAVAIGCAVVAAGYLTTGTGMVTVTDDQPAGVVAPLLIAAGLFAALTSLSILIARRWVWIVGAAVQVMVLGMYLAVAPERTPTFETWGISLKVLQIGLLVGFLVLIVGRAPTSADGDRCEDRTAAITGH